LGSSVRAGAQLAPAPVPPPLRHENPQGIRLEAAQVLLGHSKADVTQVYAERDVSRAAAVAAKIG
jgi:integrase